VLLAASGSAAAGAVTGVHIACTEVAAMPTSCIAHAANLDCALLLHNAIVNSVHSVHKQFTETA
jgi:hypothetical protein